MPTLPSRSAIKQSDDCTMEGADVDPYYSTHSSLLVHFSDIRKQPTLRLNEDLLRHAENVFDTNTPHRYLKDILLEGEQLLHLPLSDPERITRLLERVIILIPFDRLKNFITYEKTSEGLKSGSIPIQILCIQYIKQAATRPSGAAWVAYDSALVSDLLTLWLSVEDTRVSEHCRECIISLLRVDSTLMDSMLADPDPNYQGIEVLSGYVQGHGLFWRRLFYDPQIYRLFFSWTTLLPALSSHDLNTKRGRYQATTSQGRLLSFLEHAAQLDDFTTITTSTLPDVERPFLPILPDGINPDQFEPPPYHGLLAYATNVMMDRQDLMMIANRQMFFGQLFHAITEQEQDMTVKRKPMKPELREVIRRESMVNMWSRYQQT